MRVLTRAAGIVLLVMQSVAMAGPPCREWGAEFSFEELNGAARATTPFDDGSGPALFVTGEFANAGGITVNGVAKWDGARWSSLVEGIGSGAVGRALVVFNGSLYVAGNFSSASGVSGTNGIARWNGAAWSSVGGGLTGSGRSLCVFDDGGGPALYVGGTFTMAGSTSAVNIAKWNGTSWSAVGAGLPGSSGVVNALAVFNSGTGAKLHAGGRFNTGPAIARWSGTQWESVGGGITSPGGQVFALAAHDDGAGPSLFIAGNFFEAGGVAAKGVARWSGSAWSSLGAGLDPGGGGNADVFSLCVYNDGAGARLYAGGNFRETGGQALPGVARWSGTGGWSNLGVGINNGDVTCLSAFDFGRGPSLFVFGGFSSAGGLGSRHVAEWTGVAWAPRGNGLYMNSPNDNSAVNALTVFDDGGGDKVYAAGTFTFAGGLAARTVVRWDDDRWAALPTIAGTAYDLATYNDGGGLALYVAGSSVPGFGIVGNIAKRVGSAWEGVAGGVASNGTSEIDALEVHSDALGSRLHVGGNFRMVSGATVRRAAKYSDLGEWSALGASILAPTRDAIVFDHGSGPTLYVSGDFTTLNGQPAPGIASWNGTEWVPLPIGPTNVTRISSMTIFDDGGGPALYVGGRFDLARPGGGPPCRNIAKWTGTQWVDMGLGLTDGGLGGAVLTLFVHNDGTGPALYAGGSSLMSADGVPIMNIARWNGTTWSRVGGPGGVQGTVLALAEFDDGGGADLYMAGSFTFIDGQTRPGIARWDGAAWQSVGGGVTGLGGSSATVFDLAVFDDGSGAALFAAGSFVNAGAGSAARVAKWNGTTWSALGAGIPPASSSEVNALAVFDDGGGEALFVGGTFPTAGSGRAEGLAKWDGMTWTGDGLATVGVLYGLTVVPDGSGEAMIALGNHTRVGAKFAGSVAAWDGEEWEPLGSGMSAPVRELRSFDGDLYALGEFLNAGGMAANRIARWDGSAWSPVGSGLNGIGWCAAVFDDGNGAALYVGGQFTQAGGQTANRIAKWDGAAWSEVGGGVNDTVYGLGVFDDGDGPALYVSGDFTHAGGSPMPHLARWRNGQWTDVDGGLDAAAICFVGFGESLFIGGTFTIAGDAASQRIARWGPCAPRTPPPCSGDANGDRIVNFADLNIVLSNFGQSGPSVPGDVTGDGVVNFADLNLVLSFFGTSC